MRKRCTNAQIRPECTTKPPSYTSPARIGASQRPKLYIVLVPFKYLITCGLKEGMAVAVGPGAGGTPRSYV
jgi:hypothetical protein